MSHESERYLKRNNISNYVTLCVNEAQVNLNLILSLLVFKFVYESAKESTF